MSLNFFGWFIGITLCVELCVFLPMLKTIEKIRKRNYNRDVKVTAKLVKTHYSAYSSNDKATQTGIYEWVYNGKKRNLYVSNYDKDGGKGKMLNFVSIGSDHLPSELEITVNKRTGKYKAPEGEKRASNLMTFLLLLAIVLGYFFATKITGINPFMN